jgi:hypothetical protein
MPRAQIKDEKTYRELRGHGDSKEKAARIANASAATSRSRVGRKGGKSGSYDDWTKPDLLKRAREIGIKGTWTVLLVWMATTGTSPSIWRTGLPSGRSAAAMR